MTKFKVGDRVRITKNISGCRVKGFMGTILIVRETSCGVRVDGHFHGGHSLNGNEEVVNNGLWIEHNNLQLSSTGYSKVDIKIKTSFKSVGNENSH